MSQPDTVPSQTTKSVDISGSKPEVLNRVCIQCNNVFQVSPDKFDAKQCSNCHKG